MHTDSRTHSIASRVRQPGYPPLDRVTCTCGWWQQVDLFKTDRDVLARHLAHTSTLIRIEHDAGWHALEPVEAGLCPECDSLYRPREVQA